MLRAILGWLNRLFAPPTPPSAVIDDESDARIARLNEMYSDIHRLTHAEWFAKWRPNDPQP
jgi:hypothetical protein